MDTETLPARTDQNVKSHTAELPGHFVPNPFISSSHQGGRLDVLRFAFRVVGGVVRTEAERLRRRDHAPARLLRRLPLLLRAFDTVPTLTEAARATSRIVGRRGSWTQLMVRRWPDPAAAGLMKPGNTPGDFGWAMLPKSKCPPLCPLG
jgi:hypothetical protein